MFSSSIGSAHCARRPRFSAFARRVRSALLAAALAVVLLPTAARSQDAALAAKLDPILEQLGPHAISSLRVVSLKSGAVLYERNPDYSLNPASNMKLFTSAAALAKLGTGYRFTTRVLAVSKPGPDGVVSGDLVLQGGGDPVLETPGLEELADRLKSTGVRSVTGNLVADDSRFDAKRLGSGWPWDDESDYYSAQVSALSVNRNVMTVQIRSGKQPGDPVQARLGPVEEYAKVVVEAVTGAAGVETQIDVGRVRARNEVRVTGVMAVDAAPLKDQEVTMEEPELFTAALFRKLLASRGIRVAGALKHAAVPASAVTLASHESPPLSEIISLLNKPSDNLVAEMLLKEIGWNAKPPGDAWTGRGVVAAWLQELGVDTTGVRQYDGSGLSRRDLVTSRAITELLAQVEKQPWKEVFQASLPIAGVDGTLRRRLKGTAAEKNLIGKTGSLSGVSALSGYLTTARGERLVFSMLTNSPGVQGGPTPKQVEDQVAGALAEWKGAEN